MGRSAVTRELLISALRGEIGRIVGGESALIPWEVEALAAYVEALAAFSGGHGVGEVMASLDKAIPEWWEDLAHEMGVA